MAEVTSGLASWLGWTGRDEGWEGTGGVATTGWPPCPPTNSKSEPEFLDDSLKWKGQKKGND